MAFDAQAYLAANPDLVWAWNQPGDAYVPPADRNLGIEAWATRHFQNYGQSEGRPLSPASGVAAQDVYGDSNKPVADPLVDALKAHQSQPLSFETLKGLWDGSSEQFWLPDGRAASPNLVGGDSEGRGAQVIGFNVSGGDTFGQGGTYYGSRGEVQQYKDSSVGEFLLESAPKVGAFLAGMQGLAGAGMFGAEGVAAANSFVNPLVGTTGTGGPAPWTATGADSVGLIDPSSLAGLSDTTADIFAGQLLAAGAPLETAVSMGTALANANVPLQGFNAASYLSTSGGLLTPPVPPPGTPPVVPPVVPPIVPPGGSGGLLSPISLTDIAKTAIPTVATVVAANQQNKTNQDIANKQNELIKQQNENAKFRPVGVTTRFGQSTFGYDANGRLIDAGYILNPDLKAIQDRQMGMLPQLQTDYERAAALGRGYLATTPQEQAQKFMNEQLGLLAPTREQGLSTLQNKLAQQGRLGLATGGTSTTMATNPEMAAYQNAIQQENLRLASQATQGGMDYAKFGLGLMSQGYQPLQTALGAAQGLETMGQGAMDIGTNLGAQVSTAGARLQTPQVAGQVNPWTAGIMGGLNAYNQYQARQPVTTQNPYVPQSQPTFPYTVNPTDSDWANNAGIWGY